MGTPMSDAVGWLTTAAHWRGSAGVLHRLAEHVGISAVAVLLAAALALPVALWLGHVGRGGVLAVNVSNAGRAVPTFAVLVLLAASPVGFGNRAAVIALVLFAIPPILTNAYVAMREVDRDVKEAAVGMGMSGATLLRKVELPLALPLVAAGLRTASVQVVATATLAALVAGGGLGRFIVDGLSQQDRGMLFGGAVLVALLSLLTEVLLGQVEAAVTPGRRRRITASLPGPAPAQIEG
jgi:osmoprotectant transport system permease protein